MGARVGDERRDFGVGGARGREDADLHPHARGLAVARGLRVEFLPCGGVGVRPGLHDERAGAVGPPHAAAAGGGVALGYVLGHRAADEAHRVVCCGLRGGEARCCGGRGAEGEGGCDDEGDDG